MLTNQQRNFLRKMGNSLEPVVWIGKGEITDNIMKQIDDVLEARELVKINVLDNNMLGPREAAQTVAERSRADVVQVIGNRFVLYKAAKKPVIELPKAAK